MRDKAQAVAARKKPRIAVQGPRPTSMSCQPKCTCSNIGPLQTTHGQITITITKRMIDCCVCLQVIHACASRVFQLCTREIQVDRKPEVLSVYSSSCQDFFGVRDNTRDESPINTRLMNLLCSLGCNASSWTVSSFKRLLSRTCNPATVPRSMCSCSRVMGIRAVCSLVW